MWYNDSIMEKEGENMRILVVEDELHLAEALSHILKKNNYTVDVANDGELRQF